MKLIFKRESVHGGFSCKKPYGQLSMCSSELYKYFAIPTKTKEIVVEISKARTPESYHVQNGAIPVRSGGRGVRLQFLDSKVEGDYNCLLPTVDRFLEDWLGGENIPFYVRVLA